MQFKIKFSQKITIHLTWLIIWYDVQNDSLTVLEACIPFIMRHGKQTDMQNN